MPKAKKLPSGSWRCRVFSHYEFDKDGNKKAIYESFTSDDNSKMGKYEAERMADEFKLNNSRTNHTKNITLKNAIEKYIEIKKNVLSPSTIDRYKKINLVSYYPIIGKKLREISENDLQMCVNADCRRKSERSKKDCVPSPKTVRNTYGLIIASIHKFIPDAEYSVTLPTVPRKVKELPYPEEIINMIRGTEIELPCMLALWLSFTMPEILGIKKKDIKNGCISLDRVLIKTGNGNVEKECGKTEARLRKHKIPPYINNLILEKIKDLNDEDFLISLTGPAIYSRFQKMLNKNKISHMTFHDLRHESASVMAYLGIPDKYATECGGWKTDNIMKKVYTHTFSSGRKEADERVNEYFSELVKENDSNFDQSKYEAWCTLFSKPDSDVSKHEFLKFVSENMTRNMTRKKIVYKK